MRTKIKASDLRFPEGTFSQKDLSSFNGTTNQRIWNQMFECIADGTIVPAGLEKRSVKGKYTQVYRYIADPALRVRNQQAVVPSLLPKLTCMAVQLHSAFWKSMGCDAPKVREIMWVDNQPDMIPQPAS